MLRERCIIIPAVKKAAVIPDQLVKKLAGITLIQRAINTAKEMVRTPDIHVLTDSEEISLICMRNHVKYHHDKTLRFCSPDILRELKPYIETVAAQYENIIIYRASSPLVDHCDIEKGYHDFLEQCADILVTLKSQEQRLWRECNNHPDQLIYDESTESVLIEIKSFIILKSSVLKAELSNHRIIPYDLGDKGIEICGYQDWWICEKLLQQKRILFVVTGYPAVGLGHVYRALTLAHEISDHRIQFLCTRESELAVHRIAEKDYDTKLQTTELLEDVLSLHPDLVINDILDTDADYVQGLKNKGTKVANFEDSGSGAIFADYVVNALFPYQDGLPENCLYGPDYFCLRDEFLGVHRSRFRRIPKNVLITFGGTDPNDFTMQTLLSLQEICTNRNMMIFVVTGPGYFHKEKLESYLNSFDKCTIEYIHQTGMMSAIMQKADIAICSAGRTVYELAHMRIPAIVLAQHEREHTHTFARSNNGFEYLGVMNPFDPVRLKEKFFSLLDTDHRHKLYRRMNRFRFSRNKNRVIKKILSLLEGE